MDSPNVIDRLYHLESLAKYLEKCFHRISALVIPKYQRNWNGIHKNVLKKLHSSTDRKWFQTQLLFSFVKMRKTNIKIHCRTFFGLSKKVYVCFIVYLLWRWIFFPNFVEIIMVIPRQIGFQSQFFYVIRSVFSPFLQST